MPQGLDATRLENFWLPLTYRQSIRCERLRELPEGVRVVDLETQVGEIVGRPRMQDNSPGALVPPRGLP